MLARLRSTLDFLPSPIEDKPGLMIRDPFQFTDAVLIVPPGLIECLEYFDGQHSMLDLRGHLVKLVGDDAGALEQQLSGALSEAGFLEDDAFHHRRECAENAFADSPSRQPAHAGAGYPDNDTELRETFKSYLGPQKTESHERVLALSLIHISEPTRPY